MKKYVSIEKMSKKAQKEQHAKNRTMVYFSTGTQIHKDKRKESRAKVKSDLRRSLIED